MEIELDETQTEAVNLCLNVSKRITVVSGGPGTGKTTISRLAVEQLQKAGYRVALAAPTGKAARRITQATGLPAVTIHKLLEFPHPGERDPETGKALAPGFPNRKKERPLDFHIVFVDESAMIPDLLYRQLIDALPAGGCIRFFGDINQLRPIETGPVAEKFSPFERLLKTFPTVILQHNHRQGEGSGIITAAKAILSGRIPSSNADFRLAITDTPQATLSDHINRYIDAPTTYASMVNQVILPQRVRAYGSNKINQLIQLAYNKPTRDSYKPARHAWAKTPEEQIRLSPNDKVIWTQNNYCLDIFNGEIGIVKELTEYSEVIIQFEDREVVVPNLLEVEYEDRMITFDPQKDIELAYAITTHKAQGSEFNNIVYLMNKSAQYNQCRGNFYTAITRARNKALIISDPRSLSNSVTRKESLSESTSRNK